MIVDCHTHLDAQAGDSQFPEHLSVSEMIDWCIVLGSNSSSSDESNGVLSEYVGKYKNKFVGFGVVNPVEDDISVKHLKTFRDKLGLLGVVLYCCDHKFHPAHSRAMRFYHAAQECSMPVFFHGGGTLNSEAVLDFAQPYLIDEIARSFPELKIVIGSMGMPFVDQSLAMIAKHKNVYADLTIQPERVWKVYNIVVSAYERGVMDKLLFGSGYPASRADECIETLLGFNKILGDTSLPTVPRGSIRGVVERDTLSLLGIATSE